MASFGLASSRWIADATIRTLEERRPTLTLCYLPHLDYDHQRFGPSAPRSLEAISVQQQSELWFIPASGAEPVMLTSDPFDYHSVGID